MIQLKIVFYLFISNFKKNTELGLIIYLNAHLALE